MFFFLSMLFSPRLVWLPFEMSFYRWNCLKSPFFHCHFHCWLTCKIAFIVWRCGFVGDSSQRWSQRGHQQWVRGRQYSSSKWKLTATRVFTYFFFCLFRVCIRSCSWSTDDNIMFYGANKINSRFVKERTGVEKKGTRCYCLFGIRKCFAMAILVSVALLIIIWLQFFSVHSSVLRMAAQNTVQTMTKKISFRITATASRQNGKIEKLHCQVFSFELAERVSTVATESIARVDARKLNTKFWQKYA